MFYSNKDNANIMSIKNKVVKSKIVTTIGPATFSEDMLIKLREAGADVFRLNFSHASENGDEMVELFHRIHKVCPDVGILCDIQGPKIRVGEFEQPAVLDVGDEFKIYQKEVKGNKHQTCISYDGFLKDVDIGDSIFINDGLIRLKIIEKNYEKGFVNTKVITSGPISTKKGVNIPSGTLSAKNPTEKDRKDLKIIAKLEPEYVAASFIANEAEVRTIRNILNNAGASDTKIISKIERPVAVSNFDEILTVSDGIMVARGDLGVEIPAELVPIRQKEMILKCNRVGKPVIVATQMLESMTQNPVPTRAEVNDVFNAVYDRSDAVMLSGETSIGKHPIKTVEYMNKIINTAEKYIPNKAPNETDSEEPDLYEAMGHAIYEMAEVFHNVNFRGKIIMFTRGGVSCRMTAKYRPRYPIFAITAQKSAARSLKLVWGVKPYFVPSIDMEDWSSEKILFHGIRQLVQFGDLEKNEHVICAISSRLDVKHGFILGLYYVKDLLKGKTISKLDYNPDWDK